MEKTNFYTFNPMELGEEIRQARIILKITQSDLAKMVKEETKVNLSQREISLIEKGTGNPTLKKLEAIAKVLNKEWVLK
jgi:transcriptional regulator with XRE-family HTH domain